MDRLGAMRPILIGAAVGVATLVLFASCGVRATGVQLALIYTLFPVCQGLSISNSMTNGLRSLPENLQADGNAAFNTIQQLGGAIGTAIATSIVNSAQAVNPGNFVAGTAAGTQTSFNVLLGIGIIAFVSAVSVFFRPGRRRLEAESID